MDRRRQVCRANNGIDVWQDAAIGAFTQHRRYDTFSTWISSFFYLGFAFVVTTLVVWPKTQPLWNVLRLAGLSPVGGQVAALVVAAIALTISAIGFYRYYTPPTDWCNKLSLNNKQAALLGLRPPLTQAELEQERALQKQKNQREAVSRTNALLQETPSIYSPSSPYIRTGYHKRGTSVKLSPMVNEGVSPMIMNSSLHMRKRSSNYPQAELHKALCNSPIEAGAGGFGSNVFGIGNTSSGNISQTLGYPVTPKYTSHIDPLGSGFRYANTYRDELQEKRAGMDFLLDAESSESELHLAADNLQRRLGIEDRIEEWAQNGRVWLAKYVVLPMLKKLAENDRHFEAWRHHLLTTTQLPETDRRLLSEIPADNNYQQKLFEYFQQKAPNEPHVICRKELERYYNFGKQSTNSYALGRLKDLGQGYATFRNFECHRSTWQSGLPSDSQIVLRAFCVYMDEKMNSYPFSTRHFVEYNSSLDKSVFPASIAFAQTKVSPPYVLLVHSSGAGIWPIKPGRNNIFYAIALFAFYAREKLGGKLDHFDLKDPSLSLLEVPCL